MGLIYLIILLATAPYLVFAWLWGVTLSKRLIEREWQKKRGLLGAVAAWESLSAEERMELERKKIVERQGGEVPRGVTAWVQSPTPKEEDKGRTEKVFKEGLTQPPPEGEWQNPQEPVNLRPNP